MKIKIKHYDTTFEVEEDPKYFQYPNDKAIITIIKEVFFQIKELKNDR